MLLNEENTAKLSSKLRSRYYLENIPGDFVFFDGETTDVVDVFDLDDDKKKIVRSDIGYLFPSAKEGISFDLIAKLGKNIFLIDIFSFSKPLKPNSDLKVDNYEKELVILAEKEKTDASLIPLYSDSFHAIIEKTTFKDFLDGERGIKENEWKSHYLLINTDEDPLKFSSAVYIFKTAMKNTAERLCLIDKGDSREFQGVDLCRK